MNDIDEGKYGQPFITDYIFDEILSLVMIRKGKDYAIKVGKPFLKTWIMDT
ncbi:hypothetical protein SJAV_09120 [Sulfurisphaera javensis]|uniref:Uncharacterized protein n=1 Tax=Sulfurisphaera javensis TaxID=2049879 RepID=A0AAT9GQ53_9CREN